MSLLPYEITPTRPGRVRWTLLEPGIPFERVSGFGIPGSAGLNAVSPPGNVPELVDDRRKLFDSAATCTWFADSHPEKALVAPSGRWERALHEPRVSFCPAGLEAHLWSTARNTDRCPAQDRVSGVLERNAMEGCKALEVLDGNPGKTPHLVGGRFSVTGIIVGFATSWATSWATNWAARLGWLDGLPGLLACNEKLLAMRHCSYGGGGAGPAS